MSHRLKIVTQDQMSVEDCTLEIERMDTYRGNVPEGRLEPVRRERRTGREKPRGTQTVAGRDQGAAADAADPGEGGSGLGVPAGAAGTPSTLQQTHPPAVSGQAAASPSSPVMVAASSPSTAVQQQGDVTETDLILQLHNSIFEDIKCLIHPIAASITAINTRLNDMGKHVAASSAAIAIPPGPAFVSADVSSGTALPVPAADVSTYNLATAALNVPQQAPVVRNHTLAPHLRRQIICLHLTQVINKRTPVEFSKLDCKSRNTVEEERPAEYKIVSYE
ncbi:hypothetical protein EOD39_10516 [Acipenser ruthenus]|uniref:Uncharacterized protein n=1 Tax=Acipenser ruthenus TaxID=7906 RepID=A0A444TXI1_ACIRT|nr:hypothetical protein EOD39_10516 [Acipenser ruthenus]